MKDRGLKNLRVEYGKQLTLAGRSNPDIVVLEGDLKESTQSIQFQEAFPERFFEMGIAEQNMVGVAAGLARCGKIPIVHSFASFISMKACEQVRTNLAFQNLNVKLVVSHAGVSAGSAGTTHHAIEDIAIMRAMPNMTVMVPGDSTDVKLCVEHALQINGPVYLRISASDVDDFIPRSDKLNYQPSYIISKGSGMAIITTGITLNIGVHLSRTLSEWLLEPVMHIHISTIKPLDEKAVIDCAKIVKWMFTIEEHNIIGGLGSAISEIVSGFETVRLHRFGIEDHYCQPGTQQYILEKEGITPELMINQIKKIIAL